MILKICPSGLEKKWKRRRLKKERKRYVVHLGIVAKTHQILRQEKRLTYGKLLPGKIQFKWMKLRYCLSCHENTVKYKNVVTV